MINKSMKVVSTNIAEPREIMWRGKAVSTGIFKTPSKKPILLQQTDVKGDHVIDRRFHGGIDKACYLYSVDHYPYWQQRYPDLEWHHGMFGENITVEGLDEKTVFVGDTYQLGTALVQVAQPRQPCFKLGAKFKNQGILKEFIGLSYSGVYLRVIEEGIVQKGDEFIPKQLGRSDLSIAEVFGLLYRPNVEQSRLQAAMEDEFLSNETKKSIEKKLK